VQSLFKFPYIDNNHNPDVFEFSGNKPVARLEFVGDTKGDEAGTETGVKIKFSPIKLTIEKCKYE
jgi:hypothetical protein